MTLALLYFRQSSPAKERWLQAQTHVLSQVFLLIPRELLMSTLWAHWHHVQLIHYDDSPMENWTDDQLDLVEATSSMGEPALESLADTDSISSEEFHEESVILLVISTLRILSFHGRSTILPRSLQPINKDIFDQLPFPAWWILLLQDFPHCGYSPSSTRQFLRTIKCGWDLPLASFTGSWPVWSFEIYPTGHCLLLFIPLFSEHTDPSLQPGHGRFFTCSFGMAPSRAAKFTATKKSMAVLPQRLHLSHWQCKDHRNKNHQRNQGINLS